MRVLVVISAFMLTMVLVVSLLVAQGLQDPGVVAFWVRNHPQQLVSFRDRRSTVLSRATEMSRD